MLGSGLYIDNPSLQLHHNTIVRNHGGGGHGLYITGDGALQLHNTILVSHTVGIYIDGSSSAQLEGTLWGSGAWANDTDWSGSGDIVTGTVNVWGDPDFVDPNAGDYHINAASAALGTAVFPVLDDDFDGEPRPMGRPDIGADEYPGPALHLNKMIWSDTLNSGQTVTYTIATTNVGLATAANVILTDSLDAYQQSQTAVPSQGACEIAEGGLGGVVTCTLGNIESDATAYVTLTAQTSSTAPGNWITNTVRAVSDEGVEEMAQTSVWLQNCHARLVEEGNVYTYTSVQEAVDAASTADSLIQVAGHCFDMETRNEIAQVVYISKSVTLRGGYSLDFSAWDPDLYATTLYANGLGRVVVISGPITATIEGFRIIGGDASQGGGTSSAAGIYVVTSTATISNCDVVDNIGVGIYNDRGTVMLTDVVVSGNSGRGMYNSYSDAMLVNVTIADNGDRGMYSRYSDSTLTSVTLEDNADGGMYNYHSDPVLTQVTFRDNTALRGAGMYNSHSDPVLTDVAFYNNDGGGGLSSANGGGMYNSASNPRLTNVVFSGNEVVSRIDGSGNGGGMYNTSDSNPVLNHVTFRNNSASHITGRGGGMYNSSDSSPVLTDITFYRNYAGRGGGMYNSSDNLRLMDSTFEANVAAYGNATSAPGDGGGMYNTGSPTLINVTFDDNTAFDDGGGLYSSGSPTLINTIFKDNTTLTDDGGGMYGSTGSPVLINSTFSNNIADGVGDGMRIYTSSSSKPMIANSIIWGSEVYVVGSGTVTITYSLVEGGCPSGATCSNIISNDPLFAASPDDLHLQSNSPAIDAGDNTAVPADTFDLDDDGDTSEPIPYDLEGNPRFIDHPKADTGNGTPPIVNMGAYETIQTVEVEFSSPSYNANESMGTATITATLSLNSTDPISVEYATTAGSAIPDADYTPVSGTLTFAPGLDSQTFEVPIADDTLDENNETVILTLFNPNNAIIGSNNPATLTITDDDDPPTVDFGSAAYSVGEDAGPATIDVALSAVSGLTVTVEYSTANGTATAGEDYTAISGTLTFVPGVTSQSFAVAIADDELEEGEETVTLTLSNAENATIGSHTPATLTIEDDDGLPTVAFSSAAYSVNENSGLATITVTLNAPSGKTVTVHYATSDGTATGDSDYTDASDVLTFTPGVTIQTFTVAITDDALDENDETVMLTLSNPDNATIGGNNPATLTITDDDGLPTVDFGNATYSVGEDAGTATIDGTLSTASGLTVTVKYSTTNGTATAGEDYIAISGTLTFTPGVTSQSFAVAITDDETEEGEETIILTLFNAENATIDGNNPAVLTITEEFNIHLPLVLRQYP